MDTSTLPATVTLAGTRYTVTGEAPGGGVYLTGPRGGQLYLRPYLGEQTGRRELVRLSGMGEPVRDRCGRPVRALVLGNVVEDVTR